MRFFILFCGLLAAHNLSASGQCPLTVPTQGVPFYSDLYGSPSSEMIGIINARITAEESNLRAALAELQAQHEKVVRIWPGKVSEHVVILEDVPAALFGGRNIATRRTFRFWFAAAVLTCVQLEYTARDLLDPFRWVQKTAWLDPKNLEMQFNAAGYLPSDTDERPDRIADMAPHLRVEALERMTAYLREARYSVEMQMTRAEAETFKQQDNMVK